MTADAYKNARSAPTSIESGRTLAPGEAVQVGELNLDPPEDAPADFVTHDQALINDGSLIEALEAPEPPVLRGAALDKRGEELEIEGWSSMSADQKRAAVAEAEARLTSEEGA